jgi:hypothetical protein
MCSTSWFRRGGLVLLFLCIAIAGCGPTKAKGKVTGRVKFFDKYLTCGTVGFTTEDGRIGSATIDFDGNYEMANAPVGEVTVTVSVPRLPKGPMGKGPAKPPPGVPEMRPPGSGGATPAPSFDPTKIVEIPEKYEKVETSGLKYTVEKGEHTHNITLSP